MLILLYTEPFYNAHTASHLANLFLLLTFKQLCYLSAEGFRAAHGWVTHCLAGYAIAPSGIPRLLANDPNMPAGHSPQQHFGILHAYVQLRCRGRAIGEQLALLVGMPRKNIPQNDIKGS